MSKKEFMEAIISLMEQGKICCICGEPIKGFGNNPYPCVEHETARCCDKCNWEYVIPARLTKFADYKEKGE